MSYYNTNAGTTSSSAARQRLGLSNRQQQQQNAAAGGGASGGGSSTTADDWFASATPAPAPQPAPAAPSSGSGFYSQPVGGDGSATYGNNYSASMNNTYQRGGSTGTSGGTAMMSGGMSGATSTGGGGGYYGVSSTSGYDSYGGGSTSNAMSGAIGGGGGGTTSMSGGAIGGAIPPASAFGSNPNSGSTTNIGGGLGGGGGNTYDYGGGSSYGGGASYDNMVGQMGGSMSGAMGGAMGGGSMSGAMGGPIGGAMGPTATSSSAPAAAPHVFDPNAAAAANKSQDNYKNNNAMSSEVEDYDNEPPLLEELGVNFPHIYSKSRVVLFPIGQYAKSLDANLIENDADLAGPLAFALGLGGELLLAGKMHFGYVYGFGVSGCLAMTVLLNLLNPNGAVSMWTVISILGYALLPVNLLAGLNALIRIHKLGRWGMILAILTIVWCTTSSTRLFERGCHMREQRFLVAYPTALLYSAFVMITIF